MTLPLLDGGAGLAREPAAGGKLCVLMGIALSPFRRMSSEEGGGKHNPEQNLVKK